LHGVSVLSTRLGASGRQRADRGESCDPLKWCAAMVIWSLGADGNFTANNNDCLSNSNGGEEFGNASFITFTGHSPIPATPYNNPGAFAPNPNFDMYFNPGDLLTVTMHDIPDSSPGPNGSGLEIVVDDQTTGQSGSTVDRKSTRLNSSHVKISYAVFCLKKKTQKQH